MDDKVNLAQLPTSILQHHYATLRGPLKEWLTHDRVPPVLLLTGQPGIGKRQIAHFLSQTLLCHQNGHPQTDIFPCNQCPSCLKILKGQSVDLTEITSAADESDGKSSRSLKADQFRNLRASIGFGALESRYRTVIIPEAERMTPQAANSVLKILEEPPAGWIFFLTTHDSTLLLPTLVSRCQILRLKPLSDDQIQALLENSVSNTTFSDPERRRICAALAQGSWNRALEFSQDDVWQQRKVLFRFLLEPAAVFQNLIDWASQEPPRFYILIDLLEQLTAELIRWTIQPQHPWLQADGNHELSEHAQLVTRTLGHVSLARTFWLERIDEMTQARQDSLAPLNRKLLIQKILSPWIEIRKGIRK